jgi:hypothetical protein
VALFSTIFSLVSRVCFPSPRILNPPPQCFNFAEAIELKSQASGSLKKLDSIKERLVAVKALGRTQIPDTATLKLPPIKNSPFSSDAQPNPRQVVVENGGHDTSEEVNAFLEDELDVLTRLRTELGNFESFSSQLSQNQTGVEKEGVDQSRQVTVAEQLKKMEEMSAELEKVKLALDRVAAESSDTEM